MKPTLAPRVATWPPPKPWPENCTADAYGWYVRVKVGSGKGADKAQERFDRDTPIPRLEKWRDETRARLTAERAQRHARTAPAATIEGGIASYLADGELTAATAKVRDQQIRWWCAQPAALNAPVYSMADLDKRPELRQSPTRLGLVARATPELKRLRQILARAFAPTNEDRDPYEFAETSNKYRTALVHYYTIHLRDTPEAINPMAKVPTRATQSAKPSGLDMRLVAETLTLCPSRFGRDAEASLARLDALAWIHITPVQLGRLTRAWKEGRNPAEDFHDVPEASREEIIAGAITLQIEPRRKGRSKKRPPPNVIPLTPWGVAAMRRIVACRAAWGMFSCSSINKILTRACAREMLALRKRGITGVDLAAVTVYHLKHSLATAAQLANPGILDKKGAIQASEGLVSLLQHAHGNITKVYTQAAVDPLARFVSMQTARFLEALLATPLTRADRMLKIVGGGGQ